MRIAPLHVTEPLSCPSPHLAMSFLLLQFSVQFARPYLTVPVRFTVQREAGTTAAQMRWYYRKDMYPTTVLWYHSL